MSLRLSLTPEVQDQLEAAATAAGTSIAEQVRWRAEWVLARSADPQTLELMAAVADMAADVQQETNSTWHSHPGSHAAMRRALLQRLNRLRPEGSFAFGERPHRADPSNDPDEIGVTIESMNWEYRDDPEARHRLRSAMKRNLQEIMKLQQQREQGDKS